MQTIKNFLLSLKRSRVARHIRAVRPDLRGLPDKLTLRRYFMDEIDAYKLAVESGQSPGDIPITQLFEEVESLEDGYSKAYYVREWFRLISVNSDQGFENMELQIENLELRAGLGGGAAVRQN